LESSKTLHACRSDAPVVLLALQFVSPHIWNRDVIQDIGGHATGICDSDINWWFFATLVIINVICLSLTLILCWKSKDIRNDFAEGNYVFLSVMSMFQILLLAVPVSAMVRDDNNVFFFIWMAAVFMQNFTVLAGFKPSASSRLGSEHDSQQSLSGPIRASLQSQPNDTDLSGPMDVKNDAPDEENRNQKMKKRVSWTNGAEPLSKEMDEVL
jgi:hypothetical protein